MEDNRLTKELEGAKEKGYDFYYVNEDGETSKEINKLGLLEDILQKHHIGSPEELDKILGFKGE